MAYGQNGKPVLGFGTMADLRNKIAKQEREAATLRMQEALRPKRAPEPLPHCPCGNTWMDGPLYAHQKDRWSEVEYYCGGCLPAGSAASLCPRTQS